MKAYKHVMVALDRTTSDNNLLQAAKAIAPAQDKLRYSVAHVIPSVPVPQEAQEAVASYINVNQPFAHSESQMQEKVCEDLTCQLEEIVDFKAVVHIGAGKTHRELLNMLNHHHPDLVILGKKQFPDGSGITAKRIARYFSGDVMIVPDGNTQPISRIMVAIDFSPFSWNALVKAMEIRKNLGIEEPVLCLHMVDTSGITAENTSPSYATALEQSMNIEARQEYQKFRYCYDFPEEEVEMIYQNTKGGKVASGILKVAGDKAIDLLVVGAKGDYMTDNDPVGIVTESLLDFCQDHSLLIVR